MSLTFILCNHIGLLGHGVLHLSLMTRLKESRPGFYQVREKLWGSSDVVVDMRQKNVQAIGIEVCQLNDN